MGKHGGMSPLQPGRGSWDGCLIWLVAAALIAWALLYFAAERGWLG